MEPKRFAIAVLAILAVAMSAMAAQPLPSSCAIVNKTLVSSKNTQSVTLVIAPYISAYGIPRGSATLSDYFGPWRGLTDPYAFAYGNISPTNSNGTARLTVTWYSYTYDKYNVWLNCSGSLIKATLANVSLGAPANYTWSASGNLADVINAIPSSWSLTVPAPYSDLPTDYYVAPDAGLNATFTLNFTKPTVLSGLKAGDINVGKYGVKVPINSSHIDLVVGDYANVYGAPNPFYSWATGGMKVETKPTEYTATGYWSYSGGFPSGVGPQGLYSVWFGGAIVPPNWGYVAYLTAPQAPAVRPFLRQFLMIYDNYTGEVTIYEWPYEYVEVFECGYRHVLGRTPKLGSTSTKYFSATPDPLAAAISSILGNYSQAYLPGYGPFATAWYGFDCAYRVGGPNSSRWVFWYTLYAYYMEPISAQWEVYVTWRVAGFIYGVSDSTVYVVQPAGGVTDIKVYVWGTDEMGNIYGPGGVSFSGNPAGVEYVYGIYLNGSLWRAVSTPQQNPYYWLAWPSLSPWSAYFDSRLPLEMGYPGPNVVKYVQPLYIWNWPTAPFLSPFAFDDFRYMYTGPSSIGLAEQTNRYSFGSKWIWRWLLPYAWLSFAPTNPNVLHQNAVDPITRTQGGRTPVLAPYWNPGLYNQINEVYGFIYTNLTLYPVDVWAAPPPRPPSDVSSVSTPVFTPIGSSSSSSPGFLWGLLPLVACKSLACVNPSAAYWTGGFTGDRALPDMPFALAVKWLGSSSITTTIYVGASWAKYVNASMPQGGGLVKLGTFTLEPNTWYLIVPGGAQPLPKPNSCNYTPVPPGWLIAPNSAGVFGEVLFVTPQGNATGFYRTTKAVLNYTVSTMPAPNIIQPTVLFEADVLMQGHNTTVYPPWNAQFFPRQYARVPWWPFKAFESRYGYWTAVCKGGYSGYTGNLAPYQRVDISYQPGSALLISANVVHASVSPIVEGYFKGGEGLYVTIRPNITGPLPPSAIRGYYLYLQRNGTWVLSGELRAGVYTCNFSPMKSAIDKAMKYVGFIGMIRSTFNMSIINNMCSYAPANNGVVVIYMPASQAWDPATLLPIWPWDPAMVVPNVRYSGSIVGSGTVVAPSVSGAQLFNYWNVPIK